MKIIDSGKDFWETRDEEFDFIADLISKKRGLNLEFGVFEGKSINYLSEKLPNKKFVGFDSFEGLPEDWIHGTKNRKKGHFTLNGKLPEVNKNVTLIKGFYDSTLEPFLKETKSKKISYLHLDSDLYSSTKYVLTTLTKYSMNMKDCIVRFDDFCDWRYDQGVKDKRSPRMPYTNWKNGDYKAWNEWVEENNIEYEEIARNWDKSYIVRIK